MCCTVQELRQLGYQVRIKHERHFRFMPIIDLFITKGELRFDNSKVISGMLSDIKTDIENYLDQDSDPQKRVESIHNLFDVDNNSGMTTVSIYMAGKTEPTFIGQGVAKVNDAPNTDGSRDTFCKKEGLRIAMMNALRDANKNGFLNMEQIFLDVAELRKQKTEKSVEVTAAQIHAD